MTAYLLTGQHNGQLVIPYLTDNSSRLMAATALSADAGFGVQNDGEYDFETPLDTWANACITGAKAYVIPYTGSFTDGAAMKAAFENAFGDEGSQIVWR